MTAAKNGSADGTEHLDFIRNCFILASESPGSSETFYVTAPSEKVPRVFCSCSPGKGNTGCIHSSELIARARSFLALCNTASAETAFHSSLLYRLLEPCIRSRTQPENLRFTIEHSEVFTAADSGASPIISIRGTPPSIRRLCGRMGVVSDADRPRNSAIRAGRRFALTDVERELTASGMRSTRMSEEDSAWFIAVYHCFMESGGGIPDVKSWVDHNTGRLHLSARYQALLMEVVIPCGTASSVLRTLGRISAQSREFSVDENPHELIFSVDADGDHSDAVRLCNGVRLTDAEGSGELIPAHSKFIHGDLLYSCNHRRYVRLSPDSMATIAVRLHELPAMSRDELGSVIERHAGLLFAREVGTGQMNLFGGGESASLDRITDPPLVTRFDGVEIDPVEMGDVECRVKVFYLFEGRRIGLDELLRARDRGVRFLVSAEAIVDMTSEGVDRLPLAGAGIGSDGTVTLPRAALLQFSDGFSVSTAAAGGRFSREFTQLMAIAPAQPLLPLTGYTSELRGYQRAGVEWLLFLYDNHFGGILCDEMGLGKTHQALALIAALREQRGALLPVLVVCPATVAGHWLSIIRTFAPGLGVMVHLGSDRDLSRRAPECAVIITSYGILKNDIASFSTRFFTALILDEAQCIKNRATGAWEAARSIRARMRLAITGTPIENSLTDLKSIFDVVLPGYLGSDADFLRRFLDPIESVNDEQTRKRFRSLASPFILRRLKADVCTELPEKIVDIRECGLSDQQRDLYDAVMRGDAAALSALIRDGGSPVPYMHVFRILDRLKQICDHPALFFKDPVRYEECQSDKFDVFCEVLAEALDGGEKVVVFSQYLTMIEILCSHLRSIGRGHVVLTGATANRDDIIRRFNTDPAVRVFVGSLKAGGLGIDLTAASIVIHYDRWWNAAREDQATDRVHRIGQTRGVQVVKFVTGNTIEERIHAIIERKAVLAQENLLADRPDEAKMFTREELLEILGG